jgi:hypothetical protein
MAFLDNSGDIILDAVLTETGRKRMAEGNFRITKFALGDDEIDYSLYNKNHPSGSAYYDLEILQTPIFEAFTQVNAGINYGLLPATAMDLLYLPVLAFNELGQVSRAISRSGGVFYAADSSNDTTATNRIAAKLTNANIGFMKGTPTSDFVLLEAGIDTGAGNTPNGTSADRQSYLVANNLVDNQFRVFYDSRFISSVYGPTPSRENTFNNAGIDNGLNANFNLAAGVRVSQNNIGIEHYVSSVVAAVPNNVVNNTDGTDTAAAFSAINGPRASALALALDVKPGLSSEYTLFGGTTTIDSTTCQIIDTTIYVQGTTSPVQIQVPVRIVRLQ